MSGLCNVAILVFGQSGEQRLEPLGGEPHLVGKLPVLGLECRHPCAQIAHLALAGFEQADQLLELAFEVGDFGIHMADGSGRATGRSSRTAPYGRVSAAPA